MNGLGSVLAGKIYLRERHCLSQITQISQMNAAGAALFRRYYSLCCCWGGCV